MGVIILRVPLVAMAAGPASDDCLAEVRSQRVRVARVVDGDSLLLEDGRHLRLIGINALELNATSTGDRELAEQAREALQALLVDPWVNLFPGREREDRYGRVLAHVVLPDGRNLSHELVSRGLALAVAVGSNTRCATGLSELDRLASKARRGIWQNPGPWLKNDSRPLSSRDNGFHVVTGKVVKVSARGAVKRLYLDNGLQVLQKKAQTGYDAGHTPGADPLVGHSVQVRGWLDTSRGIQRLTLHHPANLELIHR